MCDELLPCLEEVHIGGALVDCQDFETGLKKVPKAKWLMVYGSTEAEPVSTGDAAELVALSRQQGFIQTLCLGKKVDDISLRVEKDQLWVKGQHVCPGYFANPDADRENKRRDEAGSIWHNMGDRILERDGFLWFRGRSTQAEEDFLLEQELYCKLGTSDGFLARRPHEVHGQESGQDTGRTQDRVFYHVQPGPPRKNYPDLVFVRVKRIYRDARHQSRIERQRTQERSTRMNRWLRYLTERFPLSSYALLSAGFALAPLGYLSQTAFAWPSLLVSFLGSFFFFVILRGMDEIKDVDKDRVANPTRPLPRGLISLREARIFMLSCYGVGTIVIGLLSPNIVSKMWYAFTMFYLGLMYFEFFVGKHLEKRPLLYALTHQVITLPLVLFTAAVWSAQVFSWASFFYAAAVFGAFFSYEIARKLDPEAHRALKTYRHVYGLRNCLLVTALLLILSSWSAWQISIGPVSALSGAIFFLSYMLLYFGRLKHKMVEIFATLNLLFHLFAPLSQLIHSAMPK
jgi:4-hydroxybenzoate polyprenyltransferase